MATNLKAVFRAAIQAVSSYYSSVAFGDIAGQRRIAMIGNNPDIDQGTLPEDIWPGGGLYPWLPAETALQVRSTSAQDSPAGTGASQITGNYLNGVFEEFSVSTALNGLTAVPIVATRNPYRIQSASVTGKGAAAPQFNAGNVGDLIIEDVAAPNTIRAVIPAGQGVTLQSNWTTPAGYTLQVLSMLGSMNRTAGGGQPRYVTMKPIFQNQIGIARQLIPLSITDQSIPYRHDGDPGIIIPEKNDFILRVTSCSTDSIDITGAWLGVLRQMDSQ